MGLSLLRSPGDDHCGVPLAGPAEGLTLPPWVHPLAPSQVFSLPPSVLRSFAQEPLGTQGAYKTAVDSFLQQQLMPGSEGPRGGPSAAVGEEQLSRPRTQDPPSPAVPPAAAQTEALSRLFSSVKTLTAKEELLQTLR